jgi:hypothetical protein
MGLHPTNLVFLDACRDAGALESPMWAIGSQQLPDDHLAASVADLIRARYGVTEHVDFDLNDDAAVRLDLTAQLPPEFQGGAATVLEAGTLEHVFDIGAAMRTLHAMLRPGGALVALAPLTWYEHGFYNLNPRFFLSFAHANGYELLVEAYWFRFRVPVLGKRFVTVFTWRDGRRTRAKLWVDRLLNRLQPASTLYCCALRKSADAPFVVPDDVFGNW